MATTLSRHKHYTHDLHSTHTSSVVTQYTSSEVVEDDYQHKAQTRIQGVVRQKMVEKYVREESMVRGPGFLTRLRSHTVFQHSPVTLYCSVQGYPTPHLKWYKDGVLLDVSSGHYVVTGNCGIHTLEIPRCETGDTAQYTAVAGNLHGQVSTQASVIVKRFREEQESSVYAWLPYQAPMLPEVKFTRITISFLEAFRPVFGVEGGAATLAVTMAISPDLANLQPEAQWFRDDVRLGASRWVQLQQGRGSASLTLPHLNKDDEGLYTLRMMTRGGDARHSAFVSVADAPPLVPGAPGAPMDIKIHDANRDYVILSWKPPNTTTEGPLLGYFVDRCEVGTENWSQCNDSPIKICKYCCSGLFEGHSYYFRVRALTSAGVGRPSRASDPIAALDPTEFQRLHAVKLGGKLDVVCYHDDLAADGQAPPPPSQVVVSETDRTYVVLSWTPPRYHANAPLWYYIEKTLVGSGAWQRVNTQVPVRSPRYAVFDLAEGRSYQLRVLAANRHGASAPSEPTGPITTQELRGVPSAPGQVIATRETDTSVLIQWAPPKEPNNLIGYYIDACVKGSKAWFSANHKPHSSTKFVVQGLTPGETYVFRVQAINELGLSDESQESAPLSVRAALTPPSPPYDIALLSCDGQSMVLNWKRPAHSGGSKVTEYYIDKRRSGATVWREVNIPPIRERLYKVDHLTSGGVYQFQVFGGSLAGLGAASVPSPDLTCQAWTMPEPGPAYDLTFCEIRDDSLVVEWKAPVYSGAGPITGYHVEYALAGSASWTTSNQTAVNHRYHKVTGLKTGSSYVFRVRAANEAGVGGASMSSDPVTAQALPGSQEVSCGVDPVSGDVVLTFTSCQLGDASTFLWKRDYQTTSTLGVRTEGARSQLVFKEPCVEDAGCYSVSVTNTDGVSGSYKITREAMEKMLIESHDIRHPIIPLKSELAYRILERGRMRFWLQAEHLSSSTSYRFYHNNKELSAAAPNSQGHDVATGVIEFILDHFTEDSEGTFTVLVTDGNGKGQSSLVLIGEAFKAALSEAEYQRREYIRVKEGPHFSEFLSVHVADDCSVSLVCKVANLKKESAFHWFKDEKEVEPSVPADLASGVCKLPLAMFSQKSTGVYKATISDDRGKDMSSVDLTGAAFDSVINDISRLAGASAAELSILCTAIGIQLQCHMKYYTEEMKITWTHLDSKLVASEKVLIGGAVGMATVEVVEPSDRDQGVYTLELHTADKTYSRSLDLSGEVYAKAFAEFQRLKAEAYAEKNRGKVVGGLPDVVTIMEKKTLSLTCTVCGDPKPQVSWCKNGQEVTPDDQYVVSLDGKFASLTIKGVTLEDSGRYTMTVQNRYGGEAVDIVVSVYKHGDQIPEARPALTPKVILPPKGPIEIPSSAPAPAPPAASPAPKAPAKAPSPAPPRGVKSPALGRKK